METGIGRGKFNQPSHFPVCAQRGIAEPFSLRRPSGGRRRKADNRQPAPALWYGRRRSGSHRHQEQWHTARRSSQDDHRCGCGGVYPVFLAQHWRMVCRWGRQVSRTGSCLSSNFPFSHQHRCLMMSSFLVKPLYETELWRLPRSG